MDDWPQDFLHVSLPRHFSAAAAHLAAGEDWTLVGPEVKELVPLRPRVAIVDAKGITGEVVGLDDPYGSLITDIQSDDFMKLGYTRTGNRGYSKGM